MPNKYEFDKTIFETLTKESAWVLGWILSDGCICNNRLSIGLASKDNEVLYKIRNIFKYEGPISKRSRQLDNKVFYSDRLAIYNPKLIDELSKYEAVKQKSLTLIYPKLMSNMYMRHFIRGFFEGDGCVKYNKNRNYVCINFKGTYEFLKQLKWKLKCCLGIRGSICKTKNTTKNVYDYYINGNKMAITFLNWIYYDSEDYMRLDRKYKRTKELYNLMVSNRKLPVEVPLTI